MSKPKFEIEFEIILLKQRNVSNKIWQRESKYSEFKAKDLEPMEMT